MPDQSPTPDGRAMRREAERMSDLVDSLPRGMQRAASQQPSPSLPDSGEGDDGSVRVLLRALVEIRGFGAGAYDVSLLAAAKRTAEAALLAYGLESVELGDGWTPSDGTRQRLGEAQQAVNEMEREVVRLRAQINDQGASDGDVHELPAWSSTATTWPTTASCTRLALL